MKIAIVNDVKDQVRILQSVITEETDHRVLWIAEDGQQAIEQCQANPPDLILMDTAMPGLNGVQATKAIMDETPCAILIVTDALDSDAAMIFEAMRWGALDAVAIPSEGREQRHTAFLRKVSMMDTLVRTSLNLSVNRANDCALTLIGSSSGGPRALAQILSALPGDLKSCIIIAQHIESEFADVLSKWLNDQTPLHVQLAREGATPKAGHVFIAGDRGDLVFGADAKLHYQASPPTASFCPAINTLFASAADRCPSPGLAILLSGMGRDGAQGLLTLRQRGWYTIAQNEQTSDVYGMPKAAADIGAAIDILPVDRIAWAIKHQASPTSRRTRKVDSDREE